MSSDGGIRQYISTQGTNLAFTPNSAVNSVPVALAASELFRNPLGNPFFVYGDTFKLHSVFISVPYQWGLAEVGPVVLNFHWRNRPNTASGTLPVFPFGGLTVPDVNIIFPVNVVIETPSPLISTDWSLEINSISGWAMNMINSPVALDTIVQYPRVILYVQTNFNMAA